MLLVTHGLVLFGSFAGRLSNFELRDFGTDNGSGIDMPNITKKFEMVIGHPKMSLVASVEPAGEEQS